jgi:DNA polymerase-3 subunit epsilon
MATAERQIVLDTETTGISPAQGHRIIEIGCLEIIKREMTGRSFHVYINPQRAVDEGAFRVHGISDDFLLDKPVFADIAADFLEFVRGAELVIHNAPFDVGFLNHELGLLDNPEGKLENFTTIMDTLTYARRKHPGQANSLDALCKRYDVDRSKRDLHGALLDAELLAQVYLKMTGGQTQLFKKASGESSEAAVKIEVPKNVRQLKVIKATEAELEAHASWDK